ncbi:hypothetical protein PVAG01_10243 [Phlyctema vagabunda]|uniref:Uncharacterized protein n=1 Tax=Phlyctema vagabunda TaxID=108571 RepID=A0ABR4P5J1_9HELO
MRRIFNQITGMIWTRPANIVSHRLQTLPVPKYIPSVARRSEEEYVRHIDARDMYIAIGVVIMFAALFVVGFEIFSKRRERRNNRVGCAQKFRDLEMNRLADIQADAARGIARGSAVGAEYKEPVKPLPVYKP